MDEQKVFYMVVYSILQRSRSARFFIFCTAGPTSKDTAREVGVSQNTVTYYFTLFRNACDAYVLSLDGFVVGGQGKTVQIDETLMCRRKHNVGRMMKQVWIFGGICVEDRRFFCLVVPDRTRETLEAEIRKHVLPETSLTAGKPIRFWMMKVIMNIKLLITLIILLIQKQRPTRKW